MQVDNLATDTDTFTSNAYLVNGTGLIDAGAAPSIVEQLQDKTVDTVVITHTHEDHIANLATIVDIHDPDVYAYNPSNLSVAAEPVADGDTVTVGGASFTVLYTPGHRDDSICLYNDAENVLFSGDLVFPNGYWGRTDLPTSNHDKLINSIERLTALEIDALYAGHDTPTSENGMEHIQAALQNAQNHEQPT